MKRYAVVIEKMENGYGAFVPDLPGCVAAGDTYEETEQPSAKRFRFTLRACGRTATLFLSRRRGLSLLTRRRRLRKSQAEQGDENPDFRPSRSSAAA